VLIKRGAWIGSGAIILPGVTVGIGSIIAAGAVVSRDIPDFSVAAGNPARVVSKLPKPGEKSEA
jgi:acetyltransferase-like isoleucine patch superfamily enzyme